MVYIAMGACVAFLGGGLINRDVTSGALLLLAAAFFLHVGFRKMFGR